MERLNKDTNGAVYVEFLIAFLPVFSMFLGLVQLADMHQANIIVNHSAMMAARSAVVILHDDPSYYNGVNVGKPTGKRLDEIKRAAMIPLLASRSLTEYKVNLPSQAGGEDTKDTFNRGDLVRVRVEAVFECRVPLVSKLMCGAKSTRTISAESVLPNHGVDYEY